MATDTLSLAARALVARSNMDVSLVLGRTARQETSSLSSVASARTDRADALLRALAALFACVCATLWSCARTSPCRLRGRGDGQSRREARPDARTTARRAYRRAAFRFVYGGSGIVSNRPVPSAGSFAGRLDAAIGEG
jgi:hypothetical protein